MTIAWDENQLPALSSWIEEKLPLKHGEVLVETTDIQENCFAGTVDLRDKTFTVYTNIEAPLSDTTVNIFLGYIIALGYDKVQWEKTPTRELLLDAHRDVCQAMHVFNEDFAQVLKDHVEIIEVWYRTYAPDAATTEVDTVELADGMNASLFKLNPADSKKHGAN